MAPSLMLVLLAIAVARAELNTVDDVVQFVQSNCVSIGAVANETCNYCELACRPSLELGEYCEDFCEGDRTGKCDVLEKFRPGDAARYNDTAEVYCGSNEFTDICRILRSLRDAALLLEDENPCVSAAASAEEDDTSQDKDVCSELLEDSKKLVLCKPSDITNEKEEAPRGAAAANGHVPLSRDDQKGSGELRPRRAARGDSPVQVLAPAFGFPPTEQDCKLQRGECKGQCGHGEIEVWYTCVSGQACCFQMISTTFTEREPVNGQSGTLISDEASPFQEIPMRDIFGADDRKICEPMGTCKGKCEDVMEVELSWYQCDATDETCCFVVGQ